MHATHISEVNEIVCVCRLRELAHIYDNVMPVGHVDQLYALDDLHPSPTGKGDLVNAARGFVSSTNR